ncbi:hypothetical protein [Pseudomonas phage LUZ7]|uniref:Uncharacterized protein n=1 Tax=Pseudomonas phage LUZ7 TaxID=655097 RepID=C8ZKA1_9CAUD|nr:hypothetical protein PP-LUZ7_gp002 [Pseudomonas phage LUZ7]CAZ66143.1 hypothetical protein [Pseudomonas phage LUZ7]
MPRMNPSSSTRMLKLPVTVVVSSLVLLMLNWSVTWVSPKTSPRSNPNVVPSVLLVPSPNSLSILCLTPSLEWGLPFQAHIRSIAHKEHTSTPFFLLLLCVSFFSLWTVGCGK